MGKFCRQFKQRVLVNIDGKNMCGSKEPIKGKKALNVVSAWVSEQAVVLGQVKCAEKSNEITAIPELLKILDLDGCIVTIDAIGCQTETVKPIIEKGADYVMRIERQSGNFAPRHQRLFGLGRTNQI